MRALALLAALYAGSSAAAVFHLEDVTMFNGGTVTGYFATDDKPFSQATVTSWDFHVSSPGFAMPGSFREWSGETFVSGLPTSSADILTDVAHQPQIFFGTVGIFGVYLTLKVDVDAQLGLGTVPIDTTVTAEWHEITTDPTTPILYTQGRSEAWHDNAGSSAFVTGHVLIDNNLPGQPTAVPEPSSMAATLAGLLGLFAWRRRAPRTLP
jgi:hypothetical protein